jgi:hypothetical protein
MALSKAEGRRFPHPSSLRRTEKYASLLWISGALDLDVFEQRVSRDFFEPAGDGKAIFPHPGLSEAFFEAALTTDSEAIHMKIDRD